MKGFPLEVLEQHDEMGNCAALLSTADAVRLGAGQWRRAGGGVECKDCGKLYYDHPRVLGALWPRRLCSDELVKL